MSDSYRLSLDGPLFRAQRSLLIGLAEDARCDRQRRLGPHEARLLAGLVELTDSIADQADAFGIDCLIRDTDEQ